MKWNRRSGVCIGVFLALSWAAAGCTALEEGLRDGVSSGLSAAVAAVIEVPITFLLDEVLGGAQ